ncbi:MAG: hypothetical protein Kow0029_32090 [Candidatus Rifleibacteriota bacterium]
MDLEAREKHRSQRAGKALIFLLFLIFLCLGIFSLLREIIVVPIEKTEQAILLDIFQKKLGELTNEIELLKQLTKFIALSDKFRACIQNPSLCPDDIDPVISIINSARPRLVMICNPSGRIVYQYPSLQQSTGNGNFPPALRTYLTRQFDSLKSVKTEKDAGFEILKTEHELFIFSSCPVIDYEDSNKTIGTVLIGEKLNADLFETDDQIKNFEVMPFTQDLVSEENFVGATNGKIIFKNLNDELIVRNVIEDRNHTPIGIIQARLQKPLSRTVLKIFASVLIVFLILVTTIFVLKFSPYAESILKFNEDTDENFSNWKHFYRRPVFLSGIAGLLISGVLFYSVRLEELESKKNSFLQEADETINQLTIKLNKLHIYLEGLKRFINSSQKVEYYEFRNYCADIIRDCKSFKTIWWCPYVSREKRPDFEKSAQKVFPGYKITEVTAGDRIRVATDRSYYLPALLLIPYSGNEVTLGLDLSFMGVSQQRIENSMKTGTPFISNPLKLIQERGQNLSLLMVLPVYLSNESQVDANNRLENFSGFVVGALDVDEIFSGLAKKNQLGIAAFYQKGSESLPFYQDYGWPLAGYESEREFSFLNNTFILRIFANERNASYNWYWKSYLALFTGLLLTALFISISWRQETKLNILHSVLKEADAGDLIHEISIKSKILWPAAALLVLFIGLIVYIKNDFSQHQLKQKAQDLATKIDQIWKQNLEKEAQLLKVQLDVQSADEKLKELFLNKDQKELYDYISPRYQTIHNNYGITHFYFIDANLNCFLRVHAPEIFGDSIQRQTLIKSEKTKNDNWGLEIGPLGTFTLRYVRPWFKDKKLIGFLELGKEIEHLAEELHKISGEEVFTAINNRANVHFFCF